MHFPKQILCEQNCPLQHLFVGEQITKRHKVLMEAGGAVIKKSHGLVDVS